MKRNEQIEAFLASPDARQRTIENIELSRKKNLQFSIVTQLQKLFGDNPLPAHELVGNIIKNNAKEAIDAIINDTIYFQKQDNFYVYPIGGHSTAFAQRIVLSNSDHFDLSIDVIDAGLLNRYKAQSKANLSLRGIQFYGRQTITYFITAGGLKVSTWEHQVEQDNFINQSCRQVGLEDVADGELRFNPCNRTMMYECAHTNVVAVTLEYKANKRPFSLMFSAQDHKLKFQNPSDELDSRVQLSMLLLKKMDSHAAIPVMKKFLGHSKHFVRWYAMQQILGIDALQALDELHDMAQHDPHPEVKLAAQQTIAMIEQKELAHAC
jgi:hypothetical protein